MNEQTNNPGAAFMEVTSKKLEIQDKKIFAVEEKINNIASDAGKQEELLSKIEALHQQVTTSCPVDKLNDLSQKLDKCIGVWQNPREAKVHHQHYVPKIIWIAAGLFIILALVCSGWFNTYNKLEGYVANDSKYRYLKLDTANKNLQLYLFMVDSFYTANDKFRSKVMAAEDLNRENLYLLQKANSLKSQAKNLEKMVKEKQ